MFLAVKMNGVRVDLIFSGNVPDVVLPCVVQKAERSTLILIGDDSPLFRAKLIELLLANPDVQVAVSSCFVARPGEFRTPHEMIRAAFADAAPAPLSFNVKEAAARLGISYSHIRKLISIGEIKKVHGRVTSAEIRHYLRLKEARNK